MRAYRRHGPDRATRINFFIVFSHLLRSISSSSSVFYSRPPFTYFYYDYHFENFMIPENKKRSNNNKSASQPASQQATIIIIITNDNDNDNDSHVDVSHNMVCHWALFCAHICSYIRVQSIANNSPGVLYILLNETFVRWPVRDRHNNTATTATRKGRKKRTASIWDRCVGPFLFLFFYFWDHHYHGIAAYKRAQYTRMVCCEWMYDRVYSTHSAKGPGCWPFVHCIQCEFWCHSYFNVSVA